MRIPAEWAKHQAVWTAWPHLTDEWEIPISAPGAELVAMAAAVADLDVQGQARGETVRMLVNDANAKGLAKAAFDAHDPRLLASGAVELVEEPHGDTWLRDTAPIYGFSGDALTTNVFRFNGWGGKYLMPGDDTLGFRIAKREGLPMHLHDFVLEGGGLDFNGQGTVLTTRQCLLNDNRNPGKSERDVELKLLEGLGARHTIWLNDGLKNDHTDGHVDTLARFIATDTVVCMRPASGDPNTDVLLAIVSALESARLADGRKLQVVQVPSPGEVVSPHGALLPATYMNFVFGNSCVVVPTYGVKADEPALEALSDLFPGRRVVGSSSRAIITGGGSFHCCTQQVPAVPLG